MRNRRTRAEIAEQNRAAVLTAARLHFEQHGYHGASLDLIAETAGFSKGAVYSRFDSKDDLFLAVLAESIAQRHEAIAAQFAQLAGPGDVTRLAEISIRTSVASVAWQAALLEFRAHAWRHAEVNARYAALHEQTIDHIAGLIADLYRTAGERPPRAIRQMAVVGLAAGTGVVAEHMADPDLEIGALVRAMAPGIRALDHVDQGVGT